MTSKESSEDREYRRPFQRLQTELASLIASTPPGERLPNEPELARQMGVSRPTLREAMRTFDGQGLIRRRQGVGTFVVGHPQVMKSGLEELQSIELLAKKIHLEVSMGDLHITRVEADDELAKLLKVDVGAPLIKIARVILAENRPVAYLVDVLPENVLTPADLQEGFSGSVLDFLLKRGTPLLSNSLTEIHAVAASPRIARALEIQRSDYC